MWIQLSNAQAHALDVALGEYLSVLEFELARTEKREARTQLRATYDTLEEIRRRLKPSPPQQELFILSDRT